jgi:formylglycine-generating enzyme required for sulfatase activity
MNPEFAAILQKLVAEHGKETLLDTEKCKALLSGYTHGEFEKEINFLLQILDIRAKKARGIAQINRIFQRQKRVILFEEFYTLEKMLTDVVDTLIMVLREDRGTTEKQMVRVNGGTFTMGSPADEPGREINEAPQHRVTVSSFYMGKHEVAQKEFQEVMGQVCCSTFMGENLPAVNVSWYNAAEYCNRLSRQEGLSPAYAINKNTHGPNYEDEMWVWSDSGWEVTMNRNANGYRLPTEAEWEYAAKGGNGSPRGYIYSGSNRAGPVAWYSRNSGKTMHPVGTKAPNSLGLYDMSGNVWEWCWDWYGDYTSDAQTDPTGAATGSYRVIRGGSWNCKGQLIRSAFRCYSNADDSRGDCIGFRLVRSCT